MKICKEKDGFFKITSFISGYIPLSHLVRGRLTIIFIFKRTAIKKKILVDFS